MKIVVCVKRVPDTEARIRIDEERLSIDPSGVKYVLSPYDEFAVEAALRTKEGAGSGEVLVVTLGDEESKQMLRGALAMGADGALLLTGEATMDGLATAKALVAELEHAGASIILFGIKAVDDDQQQVGPMVATLLGLPCATAVSHFDLQEDAVLCHREVEGGMELVEMSLPAVMTITKGKYEPRFASLRGIMAAKRKPLQEKEAASAPPRIRVEELDYPPERPPARIVGEGAEAVPKLVRLLREEAKVI